MPDGQVFRSCWAFPWSLHDACICRVKHRARGRATSDAESTQRPGIFGVAVWLETRTTAAEIIRPSKRVWAFRRVVVLWVCQKGFLVVVVSAAPSSMCDGVRE